MGWLNSVKRVASGAVNGVEQGAKAFGSEVATGSKILADTAVGAFEETADDASAIVQTGKDVYNMDAMGFGQDAMALFPRDQGTPPGVLVGSGPDPNPDPATVATGAGTANLHSYDDESLDALGPDTPTAVAR